MRIGFVGVALVVGLSALAGVAGATTVSEREYQRGYADCLVGQYDQNQHGASYKRGCRAAEDSGKTTGHTIQHKADANLMRSICDGAVTGKFNPHARIVKIQSVEHQNFGWGVYGIVALDDGSTSNFICMFSSAGVFKRVNASEPIGAINHADHENYCPADVSEADRYKYPGCN